MFSRIIPAALLLMLPIVMPPTAIAAPTLKGPLPGAFQLDPDTGLATFHGTGYLTLMGKVAFYGEFFFISGEDEGSLEGLGVMAIACANGDVLVSNVEWSIHADGSGDLLFRWPGEITFSNEITVKSTGRFVELPFAGLRGTSSLMASFTGDLSGVRIEMTGEIVDPDPLDT